MFNIPSLYLSILAISLFYTYSNVNTRYIFSILTMQYLYSRIITESVQYKMP
ncbi:Uncharacterised protein [Paraprevotella clara]|uniref:Uncharacterized protein n=1 Tax=Paraprevotella clara TaxID=454154 RepID=A0A6N3A1V1_9BACT